MPIPETCDVDEVVSQTTAMPAFITITLAGRYMINGEICFLEAGTRVPIVDSCGSFIQMLGE